MEHQNELIQFLKNYQTRKQEEGFIPTVEMLIEDLTENETPEKYPDAFISEQEQSLEDNLK